MTRFSLGPEPKEGQLLSLRDGEAILFIDLERPAAKTVALFRYWLKVQRAEYRARLRQATRPAGRPQAIPEPLAYLAQFHAFGARAAVGEVLDGLRNVRSKAERARRLKADLRERFALWIDSPPRGKAVAGAITKAAQSPGGPKKIADAISGAYFGVSSRSIRTLCSPKSRKKTPSKR